MMRIFLALELPDIIKGRLLELQRELSFLDQEVKWVKKANLHVTLHFLGSLRPERIEQLCMCADNAASNVSPFTVAVGGTGIFPNLGTPRVIWAGINKGREELQSLYKYLGDGLQDSGFVIEKRPYTPHITLGRFRTHPAAGTRLRAEMQKQRECIYGRYLAREFALVQSRLTPEGPSYKVRQRFSLGGE